MHIQYVATESRVARPPLHFGSGYTRLGSYIHMNVYAEII